MSEKAPHEQTLLASLKGGGKLVYPILSSRNIVVRSLGQATTSGLKTAAYQFFRNSQEFKNRIELDQKVWVLYTQVKLNGKHWKRKDVVSFIYGAPGAVSTSQQLGVIMVFYVVRFWPANEAGNCEDLEARTAVFAKLWPFPDSGVSSTYGNGDGFTSFRVKKKSIRNQQPIVVHSDALMALYFKVPDAALNTHYHWCVPLSLAFTD